MGVRHVHHPWRTLWQTAAHDEPHEAAPPVTIPSACACINGKGGVLKTSLAAHTAGLAALAGWEVLVIDADGQGNLSRDLGYVPDGGTALAAALVGERPLEPIVDPKRERLSYVSGGPALDLALAQLSAEMSQGRTGAVRAFERAVAPIASNYDLVVVDSPPREILLRRMLLAAVRFFVVPTGIDATGVDGIANVLETVAEVRQDLNPDLEMLGVAIGPVAKQASVVQRAVRTEIEEVLGNPGLVFDTTIRTAPAIARACRDEGLLTHEYEALAAEAAANRKSYWKMTKEERERDKEARKFSSAAGGLAEDWQSLVEEIMGRYVERSQEQQ